LIRDRQFILRTDHDNLRFIHDSSNQMVIHWFMALQELDFILEHIAFIYLFICPLDSANNFNQEGGM
jgi:hypothetical protein